MRVGLKSFFFNSCLKSICHRMVMTDRHAPSPVPKNWCPVKKNIESLMWKLEQVRGRSKYFAVERPLMFYNYDMYDIWVYNLEKFAPFGTFRNGEWPILHFLPWNVFFSFFLFQKGQGKENKASWVGPLGHGVTSRTKADGKWKRDFIIYASATVQKAHYWI